ncbi:MAG: serine/threonine protein kinase [Lachnospiraceae bacterium]|nr:serine/threonine protein kinase [Lachnospiraceae bacterium]
MNSQGEIMSTLNIADIGLKLGIILNSRYKICEYISLGNMTIMYLAYDLEKNENVLIKEMAPLSMVNRDLDGSNIIPRNRVCEEKLIKLKESFKNEISIIKKLSERKYGLIGSVPGFKNEFEENGTYYLVTTYYEGKDLQKRIADNEKINFADIVKDLLDIVIKVHKAGIIHRDIKLSNIFVKNDGKVILLDFGSSCSIDNERKIMRYVSNGFSPPEMYNEELSTRWVDNFSIGAVMYQLLTGFSPIRYNSDKEIYINDIDKFVNIPWQLAYVIMKLLELNPEKRLKKLWIIKLLL